MELRVMELSLWNRYVSGAYLLAVILLLAMPGMAA